jgi:hypothetical protein
MDNTVPLFILVLLMWVIVSIVIAGWFLFILGKRSAKKKVVRLEFVQAPGIHDLLEEGREDEAIEVYQKFAGVDEYTARDAVGKIKGELGRTDNHS